MSNDEPLFDSDIDPKRIKSVADGLRRQGEFESARMLDSYARLLQAHAAEAAHTRIPDLTDDEWMVLFHERPDLKDRLNAIFDKAAYLSRYRSQCKTSTEAAQIGADPALSVGGCESVDRNKQMQAAESVYQFSIYNKRGELEWRTCSRTAFDKQPEDCRRILYTHPQPAQDAKLPSDEDFRLHLGELTPAELRAVQAAARYVLAGERGQSAQDVKSIKFVIERMNAMRWGGSDNVPLSVVVDWATALSIAIREVPFDGIAAMAKESGR